MPATIFETQEEQAALRQFRTENPDLFQKNDWRLFLHLGIVLSLFLFFTSIVLTTSHLAIKIIFGIVNAFLWFAMINVTIHHHKTHHNAAKSEWAVRTLDGLYLIIMPNAPKRLNRYTRAHLNHHARPFHETDVDHHHGTDYYFQMSKNLWTKCLYFLELTFIGAHVPGWQDDSYMNQIPLENWNRQDYEKMKERESCEAVKIAVIQWSVFMATAWVGTQWAPVSWIVWGWAFPMLLVKNWAHYLGQFQHYDERFREESRTVNQRTKTYHVPSWFNYLAGGEISGHFFHHLYPEIPYYNVERGRKRFVENAELSKLFAAY